MAGLLRYHYPVRVQWVSEQLVMGRFTTVSRAMRFYDEAEGKWKTEKQQILKFIGPFFRKPKFGTYSKVRRYI
jgi:hypothetical protein